MLRYRSLLKLLSDCFLKRKKSDAPFYIDQVTRVTGRAVFVWFLASAFVILQFILQLSTGLLVKPIMAGFHLTPALAGFLVGSFYLFYVLMQTPVGYLLDRYGLRLLLSIGAIVCAIGCLLFAKATCFLPALMGRLMMGFGASVAFVGCLKVIVHWFPDRHVALMTALLESFGITCVLIFNTVSAHFVARLGWQPGIEFVAILLVILAVCFVIWMRDTPPGVAVHHESIKGLKALWQVCRRHLFGNYLTWLNGLCAGLLFSVATVFGSLWGVPFLMVSHHLSLAAVTEDLNGILLGILVGCPVMGWLVSRSLISAQKLLSLSAFLTGVCFLVLCFVLSLTPLGLKIMCVLIGFIASAYVVSFVVSSSLVPTQVRSVSFGFLNTLMVAVVPLLQPVIGAALGALAHRHPHFHKSALLAYSVRDYQLALSILPMLLIALGLICWRYLVVGKKELR